MSIESHLAELRRKHSELSDAVERAQRSPGAEAVNITEMKKRKLQLKEEITRLEGGLVSASGA